MFVDLREEQELIRRWDSERKRFMTTSYVYRGQRLRPLNRLPNFYYTKHLRQFDANTSTFAHQTELRNLFCPNNRRIIAQIVLIWS